jgi:hypothetical protein
MKHDAHRTNHTPEQTTPPDASGWTALLAACFFFCSTAALLAIFKG